MSTEKTKKPEIIVTVSGVKKFYEVGKVWALGGVDITVKKGEFVTIMGPSGCGKSTLLHLVGGVDRPTEGRVSVCGKNLGELEDDELSEFRRENVGIIFQTFNLISTLNVLENVLVPVMPFGDVEDGYRERAISLLKRFDLGDKLERRPSELSGGQNQRVAIARALINSPDIVLADEPTGQLDSKTGGEILSLLSDINENDLTTIIMVTHDPNIASYARRKIRLQDGLIVSGGGSEK
ncbi:MAG: ABC transporter ATP-binding protein [archaeon]